MNLSFDLLRRTRSYKINYIIDIVPQRPKFEYTLFILEGRNIFKYDGGPKMISQNISKIYLLATMMAIINTSLYMDTHLTRENDLLGAYTEWPSNQS